MIKILKLLFNRIKKFHKPAINLLYHNYYNIDRKPDPSYSYTVEATFYSPGFLELLFAFLGPEIIRFQGKNIRNVERFISQNNFLTNSRLITLIIYMPNNQQRIIKGKDLSI